MLERDIAIFFASLLGGLLFGYFIARRGDGRAPVWPVGLYLQLFSRPGPFGVDALRHHAARRTHFPFREAFLVSSFLCFFVFFTIAQFAFGCGKNGC